MFILHLQHNVVHPERCASLLGMEGLREAMA